MIFENTGKKSWNELDDNMKGLLLLAWNNGLTLQEWWANENEWEDFSLDDDGYYPEWNIGIWRIKPEPVKQVHWCNDYKNGPFGWYASREVADTMADENRIAVIRREIVDGVISYYMEDVDDEE
jgi:hypothetical protein